MDVAINDKLPVADQYLIVRGCLLMEKSSFCRKELTKNITKGDTKEQTLPAGSVSVLAYFLEWVYDENFSPVCARVCPYVIYGVTRWPDLVKFWIFAGEIGAPKLQKHTVDILVHNIHCSVGLLGPRKRTDEEMNDIRTALDWLWHEKYQTCYEPTELETLKPLGTLILDFVVNPLYQTGVDSKKILIGGVPHGFYKEHTFYAIQRNFDRGKGGLDNGGDLRAHARMMEEVKQDTWGCLWTIEPGARRHVV